MRCADVALECPGQSENFRSGASVSKIPNELRPRQMAEIGVDKPDVALELLLVFRIQLHLVLTRERWL